MTLLSFGKYSTGAVQRDINEMPSDYLHWLMETDWFEDKFPEHHEEVESVLSERDAQGGHWDKWEEEIDFEGFGADIFEGGGKGEGGGLF